MQDKDKNLDDDNKKTTQEEEAGWTTEDEWAMG